MDVDDAATMGCNISNNQSNNISNNNAAAAVAGLGGLPMQEWGSQLPHTRQQQQQQGSAH
jgi:hypothetical protein